MTEPDLDALDASWDDEPSDEEHDPDEQPGQRKRTRKEKAIERAERRRAREAAIAQKQKQKRKRPPKASPEEVAASEPRAAELQARQAQSAARSWKTMLVVVGLIITVAAAVAFLR
jgi:hypothetical protein